jgi:hypothetical protein
MKNNCFDYCPTIAGKKMWKTRLFIKKNLYKIYLYNIYFIY